LSEELGRAPSTNPDFEPAMHGKRHIHNTIRRGTSLGGGGGVEVPAGFGGGDGKKRGHFDKQERTRRGLTAKSDREGQTQLLWRKRPFVRKRQSRGEIQKKNHETTQRVCCGEVAAGSKRRRKRGQRGLLKQPNAEGRVPTEGRGF